MTELETAHQRIAQLEEELAVMARQLSALTRYVFGKRSEQTPPPGPGQPELNLETEEELPRLRLPRLTSPKAAAARGAKSAPNCCLTIFRWRKRCSSIRRWRQILTTGGRSGGMLRSGWNASRAGW